MNHSEEFYEFMTLPRCQEFLEEGEMSEDEPVEKNREGVVTRYRRKRPIYRSETVSFIYFTTLI